MIGILIAKLRYFRRNPWMFIVTTAICAVFAYFIGTSAKQQIDILVYADGIEEDRLEALISGLNRSEQFSFTVSEQAASDLDVENGRAEAAVELGSDRFAVITEVNSANTELIRNQVAQQYARLIQEEQLLQSLDSTSQQAVAQNAIQKAREQPVFAVNTINFQNDTESQFDASLQALFGFSLFFVIYTVSSSLQHLLIEKKNRIWDRLILSEIPKWKIYSGHLLFSLLLGYFQVLIIFCTFRFVAGVDFYGGFGSTLLALLPYILAIIALCIFLAAVSNTVSKYNVYISIIAVPLAMLGGAYWPLEIVSSKWILLLSYLTPVRYGMEALFGATLYGYSFIEMLQPLSILLLIAVILIGLGINLMEKRPV